MSSDELLRLLAECETPEDLTALAAMAAELPADDESRTVRTLGEVASHFGVQPQTVRAWRMELPPMPGTPGRYSLKDVEAWHSSRAARNETPGMAELNIENQRAELCRRLETVRGKRIKNAELEASFVTLKEVESSFVVVNRKLELKFASFHDQCANRVERIAPVVVVDAIRNEIRQSISDTLKECRNGLSAIVATFKNGAIEPRQR